MTGGTVYLYSKYKSPKNYINHDFLKQDNLNNSDKNLIFRYIKNHVFHTESTVGRGIEKKLINEINNFTKLSPKMLAK